MGVLTIALPWILMRKIAVHNGVNTKRIGDNHDIQPKYPWHQQHDASHLLIRQMPSGDCFDHASFLLDGGDRSK